MKKNQLALIFLTLITMLAVWYFKSPTAEKDDDPTIIVTNSKNQVLASMREAIRNERSQKIAENATIVSKTAATLEKEQLSTISEQEVLLEIKVMNLGYSDAFVHSTASGVEVIVIANESSATAALDIINIIHETLDKTESVVVNFMTADQLKQA